MEGSSRRQVTSRPAKHISSSEMPSDREESISESDGRAIVLGGTEAATKPATSLSSRSHSLPLVSSPELPSLLSDTFLDFTSYSTASKIRPGTSLLTNDFGSTAATETAYASEKRPTFVEGVAPGAQFVTPRAGGSSSDVRNDGDAEQFAKALRSLQKQIAEVLLMNTRLRQEQSKLDYCRSSLASSSAAMVETICGRQFGDTKSVGISKTDSLLVREQLGSKILDEAETKRALIPDQASGSVRTGRSNIEGERRESAYHKMNSQDVTDETISARYESFLRDYDSVTTHTRIFTTLSDDFGNMMYKLGSRLDDLRISMDSPDSGGLSLYRTLYDIGGLPNEPSFHRSGTETPPLLREYFDAVGNIFIFEEQLTELEDNYQEERVQREVLRDRLDEPEVPDEDFRRNHEHRRYEIERNLTSATIQAEHLKEQCTAAGLNVDEHRGRRDSLHPSSSGPPSQVDYPIHQVRFPEPQNPMGKTQIGAWLQDIPISTLGSIEPFADVPSIVDDHSSDAHSIEAASIDQGRSIGEGSFQRTGPSPEGNLLTGHDSIDNVLRDQNDPLHDSSDDVFADEPKNVRHLAAPRNVNDTSTRRPIAASEKRASQKRASGPKR